jgi:hypothetical protein
MSELYSVEVGAVSGPRVDFQVITVHPDAGPPRVEPSFPLNLLVDLWDLLDRGYSVLIQGTPLMSDEAAKALAQRAPWGPAFRELRDLSRGVELPISEKEYQSLQAGSTTSWKGQPLAAWGFSNGVYSVHLRGDEDAFRAAARTVVQSYTQDQLENQDAYQSWPDEDDRRLPRARLRVDLADAALLGFVRAGMRFDTASYF